MWTGSPASGNPDAFQVTDINLLDKKKGEAFDFSFSILRSAFLSLSIIFPTTLPAFGFDQQGFQCLYLDLRRIAVDQNDLPGVTLSLFLFREKELNG